PGGHSVRQGGSGTSSSGISRYSTPPGRAIGASQSWPQLRRASRRAGPETGVDWNSSQSRGTNLPKGVHQTIWTPIESNGWKNVWRRSGQIPNGSRTRLAAWPDSGACATTPDVAGGAGAGWLPVL